MATKRKDIILPIDVYELYYERMALYTYQSPLCRKIVRQFVTEHEDDVLKNLKDILDGKHELKHLLGLMAGQRKTAIEMMAAYITDAVNCQSIDLHLDVMQAYSKEAAKLKLLPLQKDKLHTLYRDIIEKEDVNLALDAFTTGKLNTPTRAFYLAEALRWSAEKSDKIKGRLLFSAYLAIQAPTDSIRGRSPRYTGFFEYLTRRAQKEFFVGNTMSSLFVRDVMYLKAHKCIWEKTNFDDPEYKSHLRIASILPGISAGGVLQEQLLEQITLTKEKKRDIIGAAYAACCFDDNEEFDLDGITKAILNGEDGVSEQQEQTFKNAIAAFDEIIFYITYLNILSELFRRSVLSELSAEFFSPKEQEAAKRLKTTQKRAETLESKNKDLEQRMKSLKAENAEAIKQAAEARNKWAGIQEKVEAQQAEIQALKQQLAVEKALNRELERQVDELTAEEEVEEVSANDTVPEINYQEKLAVIFAKYKVVFVGGNFNIMSKFEKRNPEAIIVPRNRVATADQQIESADVVLMKTDSMSHKEYYKFKQIANKKGIPFGYVENRANVELMEQDVFETLELMGFSAEQNQK